MLYYVAEKDMENCDDKLPPLSAFKNGYLRGWREIVTCTLLC